MQRGGAPVVESSQPIAECGEQRRSIARQVFCGRLLVVARWIAEEEQAGFRHLLHRARPFLLCAGNGRQSATIRNRDAERLELRSEVIRKLFARGSQDMLLVGPEELVWVQRRRGLVDVSDVEQANHLLEREDLLVAVRPA